MENTLIILNHDNGNTEAYRALEMLCQANGIHLIPVDDLYNDYIKFYHEVKMLFIERSAPNYAINLFIKNTYIKKAG